MKSLSKYMNHFTEERGPLTAGMTGSGGVPESAEARKPRKD